MRIYCEGFELANAMTTVIKATSTRTTNPILEGIKLKADDEYLILSATDGELAIEKKIPADVKLAGEVVVPGKLFAEFVRKLSGEQIELVLDEQNKLKIKYTDSEMFIQCQSASEFPTIQQIESAQFFEIEQRDLKDIIDHTIFSVATDDTRPVLKGCLFEQEGNTLTSVALDGFRLAIAKKQIVASSAQSSSIIVPARSLAEMSKLLEDTNETIRVLIERNYMMIMVGGTKIVTRCLGGKEDFINYKQIIPSNFASNVTVSKVQLLSALERASVLSHVGGDNSVKFVFSGNIMTVTTRSEAGNITENITVALNGEDLSIAFNINYFMDCLRNISNDYVVLKLNGQVNPCFIVPSEDKDEYLYLVSPIRQVY